jgi:hypothetical protein
MRLIRAWDRLWFRELDPFSLGVFRIALGVLIFFMYLALAPSWEAYFGAQGIASGMTPEKLSIFYRTEGIVPARAWWWLGLAASLTFTLGLWTRPSTIVLYVLESSMGHEDPIVCNGEDPLMRMLLLYACFAPTGRALSLDQLRRPRTGAPRIWPVRLMQINLAAIYVFSTIAKLLTDRAWLTGDFMYWVLANDDVSRWPWPKLAAHRWVSAPMTYAAILVEGLFPLFAWFKKTRWIAVAVAASFQILIAVIIQGVTFFSLTMACSFLVFLPGEELRAWASRLNPREPPPRSSRDRAGSPGC